MKNLQNSEKLLLLQGIPSLLGQLDHQKFCFSSSQKKNAAVGFEPGKEKNYHLRGECSTLKLSCVINWLQQNTEYRIFIT